MPDPRADARPARRAPREQGLSGVPAPFVERGGRLRLEDVDLAEITAQLEGRPAWVLSHAALAASAAGEPRVVDAARLGSREVQALFARAGHWCRVGSSHELQLALQAGFVPERLVAGGEVCDDGLIKDAVVAGIAALDLRQRADLANARRIAAHLGLPCPPRRPSRPPELPRGALARCGGLLAAVLRAPPDLAVDAVLVGMAGGAVLPLRGLGRGPRQVRLEGLPGSSARGRAVVLGPVARGDWVAIPSPRAAAAQALSAAHPAPETVLVRGSSWRLLERRLLP